LPAPTEMTATCGLTAASQAGLLDVLRLIAQGCSNKEIAVKLSVSELTVRTHVGNILGKLHLSSRTQAALYALQKGITSLEDITMLEDS